MNCVLPETKRIDQHIPEIFPTNVELGQTPLCVRIRGMLRDSAHPVHTNPTLVYFYVVAIAAKSFKSNTNNAMLKNEIVPGS